MPLPASRPNFIFFLPDQLRLDFLGCYGAEFVDTPAIDSIAEHGVRFSNAMSGSPVCVPARNALLTGIHALRSGVLGNGHRLRPDRRHQGMQTWPELLTEHGYATAAIGKMHFYPWDTSNGFQRRVIAEDKRHILVRDDYYHYLQAHGYRKYHGNEHPGYHKMRGAILNKIPWEHSVDHFVGEEACRFIRTYGNEQPFALMIGFPSPHCPYDPDRRFLDDVRAERLPEPIPAKPDLDAKTNAGFIQSYRQPWCDLDMSEFPVDAQHQVRLHYAALVRQLDIEVGNVLQALTDTGLTDNTVVIFSSDHGDFLGDRGRLGKGTFHEASVRIPLLVKAPEGPAGQVSTSLVDLYDLAPTILRLASVPVPDVMDAQSLPDPVVTGAPERTQILGALSRGWMFHDGRFKLHRYNTGECQLFDLNEDPNEQHDLSISPTHTEVFHRLDAELTARVMQLIARSHDDKLITKPATGTEDDAYYREGWQQPFPHPLLPIDFAPRGAAVGGRPSRPAKP